MENNQTLKVTVDLTNFLGARETFFTKMSKDGRIVVPLLQRELLKQVARKDLVGQILEVILEPA